MSRSNPRLIGSVFVAAAMWLACCLSPVAAWAEEPSAEASEFFEKRIRPLLVERCFECHGAEAAEIGGSLRLDTRQGVLRGGESGAAIVPGDADKSLLIAAVRQTDKDLKMPPDGKLSDTEIADLVAWINSGAFDPREGESDPAPRKKYGMSLEEGRAFWSFQPVRDLPPPEVAQADWVRTPVDRFLLARMEAEGVRPAADADRRTLLRRVTFDLTGLPPTPEEMAEFLADDSTNAFAKVVDRLLASTRYGERWGRHWLDVVRYADTSGNASDYPVPQAHKYRDWVVRAFNADLPYDQFLREQIAGDLLPYASEEERQQRIIATGYLAIARRFGGDRNGEHHLTLEDTIDNLGRAVLGSSIACARCHDHKFDPFTTSDYYGLYGIFQSTRYPFPGAEVGRRQVDLVPLVPADELQAILKQHEEQVATLLAEVNRLELEHAEASQMPEGDERATRLAAIEKSLTEARQRHQEAVASPPAFDKAYAVAEAEPANSKIHVRGDPKRLGDEVPRHFPEILGGQQLSPESSGSGRLELAHWLTDPANPLTARVMVNRIWQHHFGTGIVQTPNDYGAQGKPPTHPELLDYLAARFIESGWSVKEMHRLILLSHAWQVSSDAAPQSSERDPNNELFSRFTRRRLDAESLRDSLLLVSGQLEERPPGPHPFPPENTWNWTQHGPFIADYESQHRSLYLMQQRLRKNPYLALFDGADPSSSTGSRLPSTTPLQALFFMNGPLLHLASERIADRLLAIPSPDGVDVESARLTALYQHAVNRSPDDAEQQQCREFLQAYRERLSGAPAEQVDRLAWSALVRAILSGNEFAFVE
jgi:hypothetical protein